MAALVNNRVKHVDDVRESQPLRWETGLKHLHTLYPSSGALATRGQDWSPVLQQFFSQIQSDLSMKIFPLVAWYPDGSHFSILLVFLKISMEFSYIKLNKNSHIKVTCEKWRGVEKNI